MRDKGAKSDIIYIPNGIPIKVCFMVCGTVAFILFLLHVFK